MSANDIQMIKSLYERFNARDIDGVLAELSSNVAWANGMDGSHVHGHQAVREYWTRQWSIVSPHVQPMRVERLRDGTLCVEVIQTIFDLEGRPVEGQSHGLTDRTVLHIFHTENGKICRFDISDTD